MTVGFVPCLVRTPGPADREEIHVGHPLLDAFLEFVAGRARWNTVLATAFDLKVFFSPHRYRSGRGDDGRRVGVDDHQESAEFATGRTPRRGCAGEVS